MTTAKYIYAILTALTLIPTTYAGEFSVKSPDGKLEAIVADEGSLTFTLKADCVVLLENCKIGMLTDKGNLGIDAKVSKETRESFKGEIENNFGLRKIIPDVYNQINLDFGKYSLQVRAYDEAVAYRFVANFGDGSITVKNEILTIPSLKERDPIIAHLTRSDAVSFERCYTRCTGSELKKEHSASQPFIMIRNGYKVVLVESGAMDYPNLRVAWKKDSQTPAAYFVKCPKLLTTKKIPFELQAESFHDYIANTDATRDFPWRAFIVARGDAELVDNNTVFKLARPCVIDDVSWVKTGTSIWDWWTNWNIEGVDFPTAFNDETCRYYVDFAADNGVPFITLDAGWHIGRGNGNSALFSDKAFRARYYDDANFINGKPRVDIPSIVKYAHSKGIKVMLWVYSKVMYNHPHEAFDIFKSWGVDGLKIDFSDRDDQLIMRHFENITRLAAERKMLIDWHGCPAMGGFNRTYPNAINFEGVHGGELNKFKNTVTPSHNVDVVFTRMLLNPMDYTPGGVRNTFVKEYTINSSWPNVMGTRAAEATKYVLYHAPLQMLSDSPSEYKKCGDFFEFIAHVPTTWDDSKALEGEMGKSVLVARRKGDVWYVGGLFALENPCEAVIDLSKFLPADASYEAQILRDGINTHKLATDYKIETRDVKSSDIVKISVAPEGGFAIKFTPKK